MKTNPVLIFLIFFLTGGILTSCGKSAIHDETAFEKSYKEWLDFKEMSGNSYRYKVTGGSWTGASWYTLITVTNGKVTQRHFKYTEIPDHTGLEESDLEWTEDEDEINSHKYTSAAADPFTLDQIYDQARNEWLQKRKNAKTYFEADNNGLISSCGYVEDGCADDCFMGITISSIEPM